MDLVIRKGTVADVEDFLQLLEEVRSSMEHPEWFYLDPPEFVRRQMKDGVMRLWVARDGVQMAGALSILIPGNAEFNYGRDLGFDTQLLRQVVNMDTAAVYPQYRGYGLQGKLLAAAEEELRREERTILLCTVHPENAFSLRNVLRQGYTIQKKLAKYGSVRYLLRKDI